MITTIAPSQRRAALRGPTSFSDSTVKVDVENGIIYNCALITEGDARGHPFSIDSQTVAQLVSLVNASAEGCKSRFRHPNVKTSTDPEGNIIQQVADDTGTMVGRIRAARLETIVQDGKSVAQARGDVYLGRFSSVLPGQGDVRAYLLGIAQDDPGAIGLSAFFPYTLEPVVDAFGQIIGKPAARMLALDSIDFVSVPAANRHGLLSAVTLYDPQPPSGTPDPLTWPAPDSAGWNDSNPQDEARAPIPEQDDGYHVDDFISDEIEGMDDETLGALISHCELVAGEGDDLTTNAQDEDAQLARSRLSRRGRAIFKAAEALGPMAARSTIHRHARNVRRSRLAQRTSHA
jgi:hypothetical protein